MWDFSSGFKEQLLDRDTTFSEVVNITGNTVTFSATTITDSGNGLGDIAVDDWVTVVVAGTAGNVNVKAKCLTAAAGALTFAAGTFTVDAVGAPACLAIIKGGSFKEIMQNSALYLYNGTPPTNADAVETGTLLAKLTADSNTMGFDTSLNGLNLGQFASGVLHRGIDPATSIAEVWSGDGLVAGTATWGRWHANDGATGASTTEVRIDGDVTTSTGGDIVMVSRTIAVGVPAVLSEMNIGIFSSAYS